MHMAERRQPLILTIDDEANIRESFRLFLEDYNYRVLDAENGREGLEIFEREQPDLVLCDLRMPEVDGLDVLDRLTEQSPETPIIVISGTGIIADAVEAVRRGAWNYLLKPIQDMSVLQHAINQALEKARLIRENQAYQEHLEEEVTRRTEALQQAVTDLNLSHRKLKDSEEKYRAIFENLQDVYLEMTLAGRICEISPSISKISSYHREDLLGSEIHELFPALSSRDSLMEKLRTDEQIVDYELYLQDHEGKLVPCSLNASYQQAKGSADDKICATLRDISERKQANARIEYLAYFDALTDLPNRRLLLDRLEQSISRARRSGRYGSMLFLDLDRFKNINDSLGHPVGDALLSEVSRRLTQDLRIEDTVSRLGGDEFVLLLSDLDADRDQAAGFAQTVAEKIQQRLAEKYQINGHDLHITPSIGVAMFPSGMQGADTSDDILRHADTAMYRAKDDGRDTIRFFSEDMQKAADKRLAIEKELRHALERKEIHLYFQPQVDGRGIITGAETLVRWWNEQQQDFISPGTFIPIAEATGLILPIGEWILRTACEHLKRWQDQGLDIYHLAVNVSPRQFRQANFIEQVATILHETGADPAMLGLELTEGMVIDNIADTITKMEGLKRLGVELSIDDFGTGYSSLAYLKKMPLDILKIDQSFVRDIETDASDAAIVDTIISMAQHLGLRVIAEGVETEFELNFLESKGCRFYQGFLFSKAVPEPEFSQLLERGRTFAA
jgi:diguanylate cyclase (GGDEF)-like protein/PAS domain S-box-containing protein